MKVFIGPTEVAGIAQGLRAGFERIGVTAEIVLEAAHPFGYGATEPDALLVRCWKWTGTLCRRLPMRHLWLKAPLALVHLMLGWPVLCWALWRYQAFVFLAGKTLTNTKFELWLLRLLQRPVVVIFVGSDARPPYINGAYPASTPQAMKRATRRQKRKVRRLELGATVCVNAPGTAHFHERPVVNWFALGFPRSLEARVDGASTTNGDSHGSLADAPRTGTTVYLLHSPSHPAVKGTRRIEAAVQSLKARGFAVELLTLNGASNSAVLDALQQCDLVVDQLFSDTPMAGLATEAAQLGKPALVGGFFSRELRQALNGLPQPPTRFVDPDFFEVALEELVADADARHALGQAAKNFVQTEWACERVAERLLRILRGDVPPAWWLDPSSIRYLAGCGLPEDKARERVRELVQHGGIAALALTDKPKLESAFAAWAGVNLPCLEGTTRGAT
ncbi:hypothetical protein SAMN05444679_11362 [Variovorax sp. CF079]|uniref:glycosyltransferase n=1 Tax=Variovorax sp. CF079 TaxID=1882774 RepID=UPI0008853631|nr:glycosyltransferase [Variovorax sp. CF079]SDD73702.1 hypothetical protein SAMN05444679_11362 [Variovorax sp. CF079]